MRRRGERVLGPYRVRGRGGRERWQVITVDAEGGREAFHYASEAEAEGKAARFRADVVGEATVAGALEAYEAVMLARGNKKRSAETTRRRLLAWLGGWTGALYDLGPADVRRLHAARRGCLRA